MDIHDMVVIFLPSTSRFTRQDIQIRTFVQITRVINCVVALHKSLPLRNSFN